MGELANQSFLQVYLAQTLDGFAPLKNLDVEIYKPKLHLDWTRISSIRAYYACNTDNILMRWGREGEGGEFGTVNSANAENRDEEAKEKSREK